MTTATDAHEAWLSTSVGHPGRPGDDVFTPHSQGWLVGLDATDAALSARFADDAARVAESWQLARLDGVKQSIAFPPPGLRTRGAHSGNVAALAGFVANALDLNVDLAVAIGQAHDCGHPPGAHSGEAVLDELVPGGWGHAAYGAVVLRPLRLHPLVVDGVERAIPGASRPRPRPRRRWPPSRTESSTPRPTCGTAPPLGSTGR